MQRLFSKSSYYHRWVVFLMDMVLCTVSAFAATALFHFRETWPYLVNTFQNHLLVLLPLTIIVHLLLRPHMGLIRQTALYDLVKVAVGSVPSFGGRRDLGVPTAPRRSY